MFFQQWLGVHLLEPKFLAAYDLANHKKNTYCISTLIDAKYFMADLRLSFEEKRLQFVFIFVCP